MIKVQVQSCRCPIQYMVTTDTRIRILVYLFSYWRHHDGSADTNVIVATTDCVLGRTGPVDAA